MICWRSRELKLVSNEVDSGLLSPMKVPVQPVRFRIEETSESVRRHHSSKMELGYFRGSASRAVALWLFFAYLLLRTVFSVLFMSGPVLPRIFLVGFSLVWLSFFSEAAFPWLWNLEGCHILLIHDSSLTLRRELFGLGRAQGLRVLIHILSASHLPSSQQVKTGLLPFQRR
jgi:hypothetical protein